MGRSFPGASTRHYHLSAGDNDAGCNIGGGGSGSGVDAGPELTPLASMPGSVVTAVLAATATARVPTAATV